MSHTPTPWKIWQPSDEPSAHVALVSDIYITGAGLLASPDEDAAFIVKACNAHDDLVEAVRALIKVTGKLPPTHSIEALKAHMLGLAALAKAEGRTL